ncbi:MAG: hypothetical protein R6V01_03760 [Thermoplasmatota archaeon]
MPREVELPEQLLSLIGEGMFPDQSSLLSFCLAVGLSEDVRNNGPFSSVPGDLTEWEIWPMVQIVVHDMDSSVSDMTGMRKFLLPFLNGGTELVIQRIGGSKGIKALRKISELLPS